MASPTFETSVRVIRLRRRPQGPPVPTDFALGEEAWRPPDAGEIALRITHLSIDPFERLRMAPGGPEPRIGVGEVVSGRGVGFVVESRSPTLREGDMVAGAFGWREGATTLASAAEPIDDGVSAEDYLSLLGPSGLAAYFSTLEAGQAAAGDTVVIAPAAGSVGSLAGQIAGIAGARVVGIARGPAQCAVVRTLPGFAEAVDADSDLAAGLRAQCPHGVSLFLDGLGGRVHHTVLDNLAIHSRVVLLGFVSGYGEALPPRYGSAAPILFKRARMSGFLLGDWSDRFAVARERLAAWADEGAIRPLKTVWHGLESAPDAFCALFGAAAPGKQIVRLEAGAR